MLFLVTLMKLLTFGINKHKLLLIQWDPLKKHQEEQKKDLEPTSQQKSHKSITKDRIMYELLQPLSDRFSMDNRHVIQCLSSIIPSLIVVKANIQGIAADLTQFEEDLPSPKSILSELQQWKLYWQCKEKDVACDLRTSLLHCDGDAFPNIRQLLLLRWHYSNHKC